MGDVGLNEERNFGEKIKGKKRDVLGVQTAVSCRNHVP
jgi:hypothetical protein